MEKIKNNKILKIILNVVRGLFIAFIILFLLMVCLQRFSDNKFSLFNYRMFTVVSGSMKPKYDIGDVLISKQINPAKIKTGDTISYLGKTGDFRNKVITHQVISIEKDESDNFVFHTKGLANLVEDPIVYEDQLYGIVVYRSVILSFIYKIVATKYGLFIVVILPLLYIIGSEMITALLEREEKRRNKV